MFKNKLYALLVIVSVIIVSCGETDDNYKQYIENGEIEYSNKVDSIEAFSGFNRAIITASLFNGVTVSEIVVSWNSGELEERFPYQKSVNDIDELELIIPELEEKSYQFSVYSVDNQGASSIKVDAFATVYGETYRSNLEAKTFISTTANTDNLSIELSISSSSERHSEFMYFDKTSGEEIMVITMPEDESVVLSNVDFSKEIQHRTFYVPNAGAIDEFPSDWVIYTKPQNILDILANVIFTPIVGGTSIEIPNPTNTSLDVEFTSFVGGEPVVTNLNSSENPIVMEVLGLENGEQDAYLGLSDASQNQVVEMYSIRPIGLVDLDRTSWTIHSFKSQTVNATRAWGAANVIDADVNSFWRSAWFTLPDSDYPQWIIVDMETTQAIDAIKIKGRGDGTGHTVHTWEISDDAVNFTAIGTFDMATNSNHQTNELATTANGRYLRYTATVPGNKTGANETNLLDWVSDIQPGVFQ